ncbi:MAG: hypothetical protein JXR40_11175 [Pontiellaceae bacterium]|nr:hypothetical protein [Pontiellaceae bacterium]
MNGILRILLVVGVVAPLLGATVSAETREERKLRIERKYLFEQQEVVQLNLELPDDLDEDLLGRDPGFAARSDESLAAGGGMLRRPSGGTVRRAASYLDAEGEDGLFGEESDSEMTDAELRRQKLDENWERLMEAQRTRVTERSTSPGYSGSVYGSSDAGSYGSSPYAYGTQPSPYGASSGSAYASGYSSLSQPRSTSLSSLGSGGLINPLTATTSDPTGTSPSATRAATPSLSTPSTAWSTSSGSSSSPTGVSPSRSSTSPTTTTPSFSTPTTRSGFRGTDGGSLLDLNQN